MLGRILLAGVLVVLGEGFARADESIGQDAASGEPSATSSATVAEPIPKRIWIDNDSERTEAVVVQLRTDRLAEDVVLNAKPLNQAFQPIEERHRLAVVLDTKSLHKLGVMVDEPVDALIPSGTRLKAALEIVLRPLKCTYYVRDGLIHVTTDFESETPCVTAIYPVEDLVEQGDYSELIEVILTTITPSTWTDHGGRSDAYLVAFYQRGVLVVSAPNRAHEGIVELLAGLRSFGISSNPRPPSPPPCQPISGGLCGS